MGDPRDTKPDLVKREGNLQIDSYFVNPERVVVVWSRNVVALLNPSGIYSIFQLHFIPDWDVLLKKNRDRII